MLFVYDQNVRDTNVKSSSESLQNSIIQQALLKWAVCVNRRQRHISIIQLVVLMEEVMSEPQQEYRDC